MTDLYYETKGAGDPLVLLHSGGTDLRDWQFIAPRLSRDFRVVTYDQRGQGRSPVPVQPINHVADFKELLDSLHIERGVLVGHSIGGQIATDFALEYPGRVQRLVLIAPGLTGFEWSPSFQKMARDMWAVVPDAEKMLHIMLNTPECYAVQGAMQSPQRDLIVQIHRENVEKSLTWQNFEQLWTAHPLTIDRLREIETETLFIVGTDEKADVRRIAVLFEQLPNITYGLCGSRMPITP